MTYTNVLNRKVEEVYGVGKDFDTVAQLWGQFNNIVRDKNVCLISALLTSERTTTRLRRPGNRQRALQQAIIVSYMYHYSIDDLTVQPHLHSAARN